MEKQLQTLYKIRDLAKEKEQLEKQINLFHQQFKNVHDMAEDKERKKIRLGFVEYLIAFIILDFLAGRMAGEYLLQTDAVVVVMVLGIPFALVGLILIRIGTLIGNKLTARKNAADHARNEETNQRIQKENEDITAGNVDILMKITECNNRLDRIRDTFGELAPWFPECYFQRKALDFIINQLETGRASNLNQAFVYYEASRK